jgi:4-aminobutyrate--pyruvate transaminase
MNTMIYPTTNFKAIEQMVVARGEGVYVYDDHGKRYLEAWPGSGVRPWGMATRRLSTVRPSKCAR